MNFKLTFIVFAILCSKLNAFEDTVVLRGGFTGSFGQIESKAHSSNPLHINKNADFIGAGLNSSFGYRFKNVELSAVSYIQFDQMDRFRYSTNSNIAEGKGVRRTVNFGVNGKYYSPYHPVKHWRLYSSIGPVWSISSIELKKFNVLSGNYKTDYKYTYLSRGAVLAVGIEEDLEFVEMHPAYIELVFTYQRVYESSLNNVEKVTAVKNIEETDVDQKIETKVFLINFGIAIF